MSSIIDDSKSFGDLGLDARLIEALVKLGHDHPTLIQSQCIPIALQGKDILVSAQTGSGKTLSYGLPSIQKVLDSKKSAMDSASTVAAILVPTRELCIQVGSVLKSLIGHCWDLVSIVELASDSAGFSGEVIRLREKPDIVISTPAKLVQHLKQGSLTLENSLRLLVVDEADLILSYGYDKDVQELLQYLPKLHQTMLMSATLSPEVDALKKLVLNKPAIFKLQSTSGDDDSELSSKQQINHFYLDLAQTNDNDTFLYLYTLVKLKVISGKTIFFVNDVDRCFRVKLFFEAFSIPSAVLNSELPTNSVSRIVEQFNKGMFDYLIATDKFVESEKDYGVSRGVDFKKVVNVVNFDFPKSLKSYVHRAGRTGRGGASGNVVSFVRGGDLETLTKVEEYYTYEKVAEQEISDSDSHGPLVNALLKPLNISDKDVMAFKYRVGDILRGVTRAVVREARLKEVRMELLNSKKLKAHFEDNPHEKRLLKNEKVLRPRSVQSHLKAVPEYLVPRNLPTVSVDGDGVLPAGRIRDWRPYKMRGKKRSTSIKTKDPLKSFGKIKGVPEAGKVLNKFKRRSLKKL